MFRSPFALAVAITTLAVVVSSAFGYGDSPHTVKAPGYPDCSVTAYGPTFSANLKVMTYGGGTSCGHGVGVRQLTVSEQVHGANGHWYTITGSTLARPFTHHNPLRVFASRASLLGHAYRTIATASLIVPNGFAGCSLHTPPACNEHITVAARSAAVAP